MPPANQAGSKPRLYAYIDETGDEGFPPAYSDPLAYHCAERHAKGPSPYFAVGAVLVGDEDRRAATEAMRAAAAKINPNKPLTPIHWKTLTLERKQAVVDTLKGVRFKWLASKAHKPKLPRAYSVPLLYNYLTRLAIERCDTEARLQGRELILVFSHRGNTNYRDLESYLRREVDCKRLAGVRILKPDRERLLQLADVLCGALKDAMYQNKYGRVDLDNLRSFWLRIHRYNNTIWGYGLKAYPDHVDPHYTFAADFYAKVAKV